MSSGHPTEGPPPSADELQAMAWVDGELEGDDARRFEARLAREPALAREVSELRALELVARQMAPPEPMDHEWARIDADPAQRLATGLGFALALVGAVGLWVWLAVALATSDVDLVPKVLALAIAGGLALVFLAVLRRRLSTLPFDPYTRIKR